MVQRYGFNLEQPNIIWRKKSDEKKQQKDVDCLAFLLTLQAGKVIRL